MLTFTLLALLHVEPRVTISEVPCQTVAACWLDPDGKPIARPKKLKGRPLPKGDCGKNKTWLRNVLTCDEVKRVCVAEYIGDRC